MECEKSKLTFQVMDPSSGGGENKGSASKWVQTEVVKVTCNKNVVGERS